MISTCAFQLTYPGSNGDMPWVDTYCYVENQVTAGCPVHIVTNDMPAPATFQVDAWHGYNDPIRTIPSTTTELGTMTEHVGTSHSPCDCEVQIDTNLSFHMYEVMTPLNEGDSFFIRYTAANGAIGGEMGPPVGPGGTCPAAAWPTTFVAQCGCGGDAGFPPPVDPAGPSDQPGRGCSVGGESGLAVVGLLAFARRRRTMR